MGNCAGVYIGPYIKMSHRIDEGSEFDPCDLETLSNPIEIKRTGDGDGVLVATRKFLKRRADFVAWEDAGIYPLTVEKESETARFSEKCAEEIETLKKHYRKVVVEWGVVVWGDY